MRAVPIAGGHWASYNGAVTWDMIGHQWAVKFLQRQLEQGTLHHAYLLTGPDGIGKSTLARRLAQAIMCTEEGVPCRSCRSCEQVERSAHPDLHVLQAEIEGGSLKVEQIREVQRQIALSPYQAERHVVLMLRTQELTREGANALLKTLEEPPPHAVLILTARSSEALLPTVVSRCEVLPLRPVGLDTLVAGLQPRFGEEKARLLGALAAGRPGVALALAEDEEALDLRNDNLAALFDMLEANRIERFRLAKEWTPNRDRAVEKRRIMIALETWLGLWRDVTMVSYQARIPLGNPDREEEIVRLARLVPRQRAAAITERTLEVMGGITQNANLRLALEALLLELPYVEVK